MSDHVGPGEGTPRAPRRQRTWVATALAVVLLLGGGTALAVGVLGQDPAPSAPPVAAPESSPPTTSPPTPAATTTTPGAVPGPGTTPGETESASSSSVPRVPPATLQVPAIDVTSEVITVGLNPDGTLEVPQPGPNYDKAAWYTGSPAPGQVGPTVVEGHVDSAENGPSVFYNLGEMQPGDRAMVTREDGVVVTYEVYDVRTYPKDEFPTLEVYGNTDGPELRLITCGGDFNSSSGHYVNNVVVYARMVSA